MKFLKNRSSLFTSLMIIIVLSILSSGLVCGLTNYDVEGFVEDRTASQVPTGVVVNVTYIDPKGVSNYSTDVLTQNGGPACIVKYGIPSCTNYFYVPASDDGQGVNSTWKIYAYSEYSGWYGINDTEYPVGILKRRVDISLIYKIDYDPPNVTLITPGNNTVNTSSNNITFSYSVIDLVSLSSCSLIINGTINKTSSSIVNNSINTFSQEFGNGNYIWSINCSDNESNIGSSEDRALTVSVGVNLPVVDFGSYVAYLLEDSYNDSTNLSDYVTDADTPDSQINWSCHTNETDVSAVADNNTKILNITSSNSFYGNVNISCTAFDEIGLNDTDSFISVVIRTSYPPTVDQVWAINSTINHSFTIYANATDANMASCKVYYGTSSPPSQSKSGTMTGSNPYTCSGYLDSYTDGLPIGSIIYARIEFTDSGGLTTNSSIISNNLPNHNPLLSNVNIQPASPQITDNLTCNYTASDTDADSLSVKYDWLLNSASQNINSQTLGKGNTSGDQNWSCSVNASDSYGGWNISESSEVSIITPAQITVELISPANSYSSTTAPSAFICNVSTLNNLTRVSLYLGPDTNFVKVDNQTASGISVQATFNYSINSTGTYLWNCLAEDNESNSVFASANYSFTLSAAAPPSGGGGGGGGLPPTETCSDGIRNQGESGIDCGGPCTACPSCSDGRQNCHDGSCEEGTDCGGPCAVNCGPKPSCDDGIQNGYESGIDCGGSCRSCEEEVEELVEEVISVVPPVEKEPTPEAPKKIFGEEGRLVDVLEFTKETLSDLPEKVFDKEIVITEKIKVKAGIPIFVSMLGTILFISFLLYVFRINHIRYLIKLIEKCHKEKKSHEEIKHKVSWHGHPKHTHGLIKQVISGFEKGHSREWIEISLRSEGWHDGNIKPSWLRAWTYRLSHLFLPIKYYSMMVKPFAIQIEKVFGFIAKIAKALWPKRLLSIAKTVIVFLFKPIFALIKFVALLPFKIAIKILKAIKYSFLWLIHKKPARKLTPEELKMRELEIFKNVQGAASLIHRLKLSAFEEDVMRVSMFQAGLATKQIDRIFAKVRLFDKIIGKLSEQEFEDIKGSVPVFEKIMNGFSEKEFDQVLDTVKIIEKAMNKLSVEEFEELLQTTRIFGKIIKGISTEEFSQIFNKAKIYKRLIRGLSGTQTDKLLFVARIFERVVRELSLEEFEEVLDTVKFLKVFSEKRKKTFLGRKRITKHKSIKEKPKERPKEKPKKHPSPKPIKTNKVTKKHPQKKRGRLSQLLRREKKIESDVEREKNLLEKEESLAAQLDQELSHATKRSEKSKVLKKEKILEKQLRDERKKIRKEEKAAKRMKDELAKKIKLEERKAVREKEEKMEHELDKETKRLRTEGGFIEIFEDDLAKKIKKEEKIVKK
ncbi:hypothetical protein ACFL0W_02865 [Nanoarchaeota archaeon]